MSPYLHLLTHNIVSVVSVITMIGVGFFTLLNNPKQTANITLALTAWSAAIFALSHVIGVNVADPHLSKTILMFNLSVFFIAAFQLHSILALTGKSIRKQGFMIFVYTLASLITLFFVIYPDLFLLPSVPKSYFINYYEPGMLNWIRIAFIYFWIIPLATIELTRAFRGAKIGIERNQYKYFIVALVVAYTIAFIPNFLVFDIPIDPLWGMAFGIMFAIPFAYGTIKYELFNIKIIAKQALLYSLAVAVVGGLIVLLNYLNSILLQTYPQFPSWVTALVSSVLMVTVSVMVWRHLKESDILKYEFITTVTHKFRTPLTHIKWASENISQATTSADIQTQIGYIQNANTKLVELTNLLVNVSETENSAYEYHLEKGDLSVITEEILNTLDSQLKSQGTQVVKNLAPSMIASVDPVRVKFIIQTLIENAIHYTAKNATISVAVYKQGSEIIFSVKDTGIGIAQDEISRLFSKFYRGKEARMADTEGMGIGLFISKQIVERHNGRIWVESEGRDKGSTFAFAMPVAE